MTARHQRLAARGFDEVVLPEFESAGFEIIPELISASECERIAEDLTAAFVAEQNLKKSRIAGVRNLLTANPLVRQLAVASSILATISKAAGHEVFPVRAIFFDKTPAANWTVPWHQDLSIAVAERIDVLGFEGWSIKDDVQHVQPPVEILEAMVTLRLHLDECTASNGALRVIPGSHRKGKLTTEQIAQLSKGRTVTCEVPKSGALVMRPLLIHSSLPSALPSHRRVLHIEYAGCKLPGGLKWHEEVM